MALADQTLDLFRHIRFAILCVKKKGMGCEMRTFLRFHKLALIISFFVFSTGALASNKDPKELCRYQQEFVDLRCLSRAENQLQTIRFIGDFIMAKAVLVPTSKKTGTLKCHYDFKSGVSIHELENRVISANSREDMLDIINSLTDVTKPEQIFKPQNPSLTLSYPYKKTLTGKIKVDEFAKAKTDLSLGLVDFIPSNPDSEILNGSMRLMVNDKPATSIDGLAYYTAHGCFLGR